jgi:hypothetical protein
MKNKKDAQEAMLHIMYGMSLILDMAVSELGVPALPEMKAAKKQESDSEVTATADSGAPVVEQNEAGKSNAEAGGVADSATEKEDEETEKFKKTASPLLVKLVVVLRERQQDSSFIAKLFKSFGAVNLSTVPPDRREEFLVKVHEILGEGEVSKDA